MFSCLFPHFFFFKWFDVLTVEIDEITADIYDFVLRDCTCTATFTWRFMRFCIIAKNIFGAAVITQCKYTLNKKIASFFCSLLMFLPYKQYFAFKVLSLCKTVKPHRFLSSSAIPFPFSTVLFPVPGNKQFASNQDYLLITPFSCFLLTPITPLNFHAPPSQKCLRRRKGSFSLFVFKV